ncbi:Sulfoacetaldehyde dehydrogenase [Pseudovibrio axinellae]|uniref:Sulfoacetaldehyde dehydrogenase n=1 Tax=Pseudovibrio axinellae TaxID=989403 RepID=A0A165T2I1_9HYPH|nr:aldehyde dehydrogenase family protein [Pseudovibrio axinellae]KZL05224.1 Sulfoacetaldehyde dehydrogenase [Pseudovibrio axinellae]SER31617.1 Acyl-CoA reductase [Pseudovibrio axinellae]
MSKTLEVVNPYSLAPVGHVTTSDWKGVNALLETAHTLFRQSNSRIPAYQRITILKKVAHLMEERFEELALQIASEGGKPLVDARVEVKRAIDGVELCVHEIGQLTGREIPMELTEAGSGRIAFTQREPIGVVVAASAFNHPLNLIVHQVAPAVATGCPVIVKPAPDTPLSCLAFVSMLYEAGLPQDWCRAVICDNAVAEQMITDTRVGFLSFIGSARVGWMLRSKLAPGTRCALEHGGAAPVIVAQDADINAMIPLLAKGGFYHSGQVCVSVQRVFAPKAKAKEIAQKLADVATALKVGDATDPTTDCGPLIRPAEVDRVEAWVDEAIAGGAKLIAGGKRLGATTYAPTVLLDPPSDARVSQSEIFGPVICVYTTDSTAEAIETANSLPFAFQAAVFTKSLETAMQAVHELDATAVMVNDHTAFRVDWMPFAGRRHSGYNTGGIGYTMHDMTQDKMAVIKLV